MKLINCTEKQQDLLQELHPDHDRPSYIALVPAGEYFFWARGFLHLLDSLSGHFHPLRLTTITQLPIVQCVSKFVGLNDDGFLIPKTFKFGTLTEGTLRDFGFGSQMKRLIETLSSSIPYPLMKIPEPKSPQNNILGFMAWDDMYPPRRGAKNLPNFIPCTGDISKVTLEDERLHFEGKEYSYFLPSYRYYPDLAFHKMLVALQNARKLLIPLDFPLSNLTKFTGFTNPNWAEVKPLEFFLDESPDNLQDYVLIRVDDGKIITWGEAMRDPKLKLEIEMSDYWLWQEACPTSESLQSINMYWEFGTGYPWLLDKRTNTCIPTYIVED